MLARLALLFVLAAAAACAPTAGEACATSDDCPGTGLVCAAGTCIAADATPASAVVEGPAQFPLQPDSTPRVIVHDDGVVDVFFAVASCRGVGRWRPLEATQAVVALPGVCVQEVDAKRGSDGITHIIAGVPDGAQTQVAVIDLDDSGAVVGSGAHFTSLASRVMPRVAVDETGAFVAWADASAVDEMAEAASGAPATMPFAGTPSGLALLSAGGVQSVAYTDGNGLELTDGSTKGHVANAVTGPLDAVSCNGTLTIAFRGVHDDKLLVAHASTTAAAYLPDAFDDLPKGRAPGDVAIACDAGQLWVAHVVQGDGVLRVASFDGTAWRSAAAPVDAEGAVSLAVKAGAYHAAFTGADGLVRYAASR